MAQYDANNPITRLMDVELPEIKRANWNCDHSLVTTSDVLYVKPIFTDHILPNTRVQLDIDQASFANPTISPLYGRFKVKYIAYFAPYRLYMKDWRMNDPFTIDSVTSENSFVYPILDIPTPGNPGIEPSYVPPTSLGEYLGAYPAYFDANDWEKGQNTLPEPSTAFSFLAFWDFYRHYIANQQEENFYVRVQAFKPAYSDGSKEIPAEYPADQLISRSELNTFFTRAFDLSNGQSGIAICSLWKSIFGYNPIFAIKDVALRVDDGVTSKFVRHQFHYNLPFAPFTADPTTAWLSNSNVELERTSSKMIINNGELTMDQWRIANATQTKLRKYLFNLGDFGSMVDSQYGIKPSTQISKPMFLGAFQSDIVFNDVVSTAQTGDTGIVDDNQTLGSRAGYGRGTDRGKQNFVDFTAQEFGVFQIVQIILPEPFYYEGRDLQYTTHRYDEEFNPTFNIGLLQDLEKGTLNLVPGLSISPTGTANSHFNYSTWNESIGKQPYGMQHITKLNKLQGMMTMPEYYQGWALGRSFNGFRNQSYGPTSPRRGFYSTYGYPEMFTNIFANNQSIDNFQFYLSFNYTKYNVVLKKFIPFT